MRQEFSKKTKLAAFARAKGHCEECGRKLITGDIEYDHVIPCTFGGTNSLSNCRVLCRSLCHKGKSAADAPRIAKSNRVRAKHLGGATKSGRPFPGGRGSKWKRKMDGTVVRR